MSRGSPSSSCTIVPAVCRNPMWVQLRHAMGDAEPGAHILGAPNGQASTTGSGVAKPASPPTDGCGRLTAALTGEATALHGSHLIGHRDWNLLHDGVRAALE